MDTEKRSNYTERLARLKQRRDPDGLEERQLTTAARQALPKGKFVFQKDRRYPIPDKAHGRNALARVSQHGSPAEKAKVRSAVHRKFPTIGENAYEAPTQTASSGGGENDWETVMAPLRQLDPWTMGAVRRYASAKMKEQNPNLEEIGSSDVSHWLYSWLKYYTFDELMAEVHAETQGQFENFNPEAPLETFEYMGHKVEIYHTGESTGEANEFIAYIDGEFDEMSIANSAAEAAGNARSRCLMLPRTAISRESVVGKQAQTLVDEILKTARTKKVESAVSQLTALIAAETKTPIKEHLQVMLVQAKQLSEGRRKRVVLLRPCVECKQAEDKIEECERCRGCGIDPEFQIRIFEDPRNPLNEIIPPVRRPVTGG